MLRLARNDEVVLGLFTSSPVVAVTLDGFGTRNSAYLVKELRDPASRQEGFASRRVK